MGSAIIASPVAAVTSNSLRRIIDPLDPVSLFGLSQHLPCQGLPCREVFVVVTSSREKPAAGAFG